MTLWPPAVTPEQVAHSDLPVTVLVASGLAGAGVGSGLGASAAAAARFPQSATESTADAVIIIQCERFIADSLIVSSTCGRRDPLDRSTARTSCSYSL